jgi:dCTP deaminase
MILSDREIRAAIGRDFLRLTPQPPPEAWSSTAVDLRLSPLLRRWKEPRGGGMAMEFQPADPEFDFHALTEQFCDEIKVPAEGYRLEPRSFVLGWTVEAICLPHHSRLAARVEGKSSLARLGLGVHVTAPTIHAGFGHRVDASDHAGTPLQLEIWHVGPLPIRLVPDMPICQLIFEEVHGTPEKGYVGMFADQSAT